MNHLQVQKLLKEVDPSNLVWTSYGVDGKSQVTSRLIDLSTQHLQNILVSQPQLNEEYKAAILVALLSRVGRNPYPIGPFVSPTILMDGSGKKYNFCHTIWKLYHPKDVAKETQYLHENVDNFPQDCNALGENGCGDYLVMSENRILRFWDNGELSEININLMLDWRKSDPLQEPEIMKCETQDTAYDSIDFRFPRKG